MRPPVNPFIYGLVDPLEPDHIRYIGKSSYAERPTEHKWEALRYKGVPTYKINWIRKLLNAGRMYQILHLEDFNFDTSNEELNRAEKRHIAEKRAQGHRLTNATDGGEGNPNPSEETRRKMGLAAKEHWKSQEFRDKRCASMLGNTNARGSTRTEEICQKISRIQTARFQKVKEKEKLVLSKKFQELDEIRESSNLYKIISTRKIQSMAITTAYNEKYNVSLQGQIRKIKARIKAHLHIILVSSDLQRCLRAKEMVGILSNRLEELQLKVGQSCQE